MEVSIRVEMEAILSKCAMQEESKISVTQLGSVAELLFIVVAQSENSVPEGWALKGIPSQPSRDGVLILKQGLF